MRGFPKHLLGLDGLEAAVLSSLLDTARSFVEISERDIKKVPTLRGKTVVNFFFEPSTRTRASFEIAAKRLSADTINLSGSASSAMKGESLIDTGRNLQAMGPDVIVVRHGASGAPRLLAKVVTCSVVNAGDGTHEHPTQALLDLFTIRERKGRIEGLEVAIVGDVLHSRVARSNLFGLRTLGASVRLVGPPTLVPPGLEALGAKVFHDLRRGLEGVDAIMMLRLQRERMGANFLPTLEEYARTFCLTREVMEAACPEAIVLHPGPMNRGIEIASEVADGPFSMILDQVTNGVAVRMALLYWLVAGRSQVPSESLQRTEPDRVVEERR